MGSTEKDTPTALQVREMKRIEGAGGYAVVINAENVDKLVEVIDALRGVFR